nr:nitroreductase family protein [Clostridioides sp.]
MDILECISSKRSGRSYTDQEITDDTFNELLNLGVKAATGSNEQPWGFVIIKDKEEIEKLNLEIKKYVAENLENLPYFKQYESWLHNPKMDLLYRSPYLLLIYGNTDSHWHVYDCTLAASNIMLAAHSMGIGTCWIGFAEDVCDTKEFKEKYNVPENYSLITTLTMGYMKKELDPPVRKEPKVFYCK